MSLRIARLARVTQSATLAYPGTLAGYTLVLLCVAAARALALSARPTVEGPLIRMFITHTVHLHPRFAFTFGTGAIIAPLLGIIWAHAAHLRFAFTFGTAAMPAPIPTETGKLGEASVLILLGTDLAGKPLATPVPTVPVATETTLPPG